MRDMPNIALHRALTLAEGRGMDVEQLARELAAGSTTLYAKRTGDKVELYTRGVTEADLGSVPVLLFGAQFSEPTSN